MKTKGGAIMSYIDDDDDDDDCNSDPPWYEYE
jgi:hypothetical protein